MSITSASADACRFRVFYGDGTTADFVNPEDVTRRWNVAGIVQPDPHEPSSSKYKGRETPCCRFEYYLYADSIGYWVGLKTESDMLDWVLNVGFPDIRNILKGRIMPWRDFEQTWERMKQDDILGLPKKCIHDPYNELGLR